MSDETDGGPVFPTKAKKFRKYTDTELQVLGGRGGQGEFVDYQSSGISTRDYFAAAALKALGLVEFSNKDEVAKFCYELADAMLKARGNK